MTPHEFLQHFGTLAESPQGVPKLRELILELAVRGKLVEQDEDDEPVANLRAAVSATLADQVKAGTRRKPKPLPRIEVDDHSFGLPPNWDWVRLGELADWAIGSGFPKKFQGHPDKPILFCKVGDMNRPGNERFVLSTEHTVDDELVSQMRAKVHSAGTVVFPKIGGAIATNKRRILTRDTASDNNCLGLTPIGLCSTEWLHMLLTSIDITAYQSGTSVPSLSQGTLSLIVIAVPPLAEQHRIVAKVDELMGLCDRLEAVQGERRGVRVRLNRASLDRLTSSSTARGGAVSAAWQRVCDHFEVLYDTPETLSDLRQTILQLAVQGKLVPQAPNDEPTSVLPAKIADELNQLIKAKEVRKPKAQDPIAPDEIPFEVPTSWEWIQASDAAKPTTVITYGILKPEWGADGVPTVRVKDMKNGKIVLTDLARCSPARAEKFSKTTLDAGDLLIAKDGATLGKTGFVPPELQGGNVTQHVIRFAISRHLWPEYIRLVVDSPHGQAWMRGETKGVALPGINVGDFRRMPIPLLGLSEQKRIVSKVTHLLSQVTRLESTLTRREATRTQLLTAAIHAILDETTSEISEAGA